MTGQETGYPALVKRGYWNAKINRSDRRMHPSMLYTAWRIHPFFSVRECGFCARGPPVSFISKKQEMEDTEMSEWIRIRIKDFYKDAVGETEYTYVSHEVY